MKIDECVFYLFLFFLFFFFGWGGGKIRARDVCVKFFLNIHTFPNFFEGIFFLFGV